MAIIGNINPTFSDKPKSPGKKKKRRRWHRHRTIQLHCAAAARNGARTALGDAPRKFRRFRMGEVQSMGISPKNMALYGTVPPF